MAPAAQQCAASGRQKATFLGHGGPFTIVVKRTMLDALVAIFCASHEVTIGSPVISFQLMHHAAIC